MKIKLYLYALLSICFSLNSEAQWTEVSNFNQVINDLVVHNNQLNIVGNFTQRDGNICYWSCIYTGDNFVNQQQSIGGNGLVKLASFDNSLYGVGGLSFGSSAGVSKFNGISWEAVSGFSESHSGIFADENELYVGSDFGKISKKTITGSFTPMPSMDQTSDIVSVITKYNGDMIIAGRLDTYNGTELNNIARWDGSDWQPLGGGLSNQVRCMAVYNSELYVGGTFNTAGGTNAKYIAKWNGSTWSNVGGSMTGSGFNGVRDMAVYNGKLYVVGDFTEMGGVSTKYVAIWNGQNWSNLDLDVSADFANSVAFFEDKIYVGTFSFTNAILYTNATLTGLDDIKKDAVSMNLFPNPAYNNVNLTLSSGNSDYTIEIFDSKGSLISKNAIKGDSHSYSCTEWQSGFYFILLRDAKTGELIQKQRFIKN